MKHVRIAMLVVTYFAQARLGEGKVHSGCYNLIRIVIIRVTTRGHYFRCIRRRLKVFWFASRCAAMPVGLGRHLRFLIAQLRRSCPGRELGFYQ